MGFSFVITQYKPMFPWKLDLTELRSNKRPDLEHGFKKTHQSVLSLPPTPYCKETIDVVTS